jgi:hypothetical protein
MWYPIDGNDLPRAPVEDGNNVAVAIKPEDAPSAAELADWIQFREPFHPAIWRA